MCGDAFRYVIGSAFVRTVFVATVFLLAGGLHAATAIDFESGVLDGWQVVDEKSENLGDQGPSSWQIRDSELGLDGKALYQASNIWGSPGDTMLMGTFLIYTAEIFTSFILTVDVATIDDDGMGLVWGYKSPADHYRMMMINDRWPDPPLDGLSGPFVRIDWRISDDEPWYERLTYLKEDYVPYPQGERIQWSLEVTDGRFNFTSSHGVEFSAEHADYDGGHIGFQLYAQSGIEFDNLVIMPTTVTSVDPAGKAATTWAAVKSAR